MCDMTKSLDLAANHAFDLLFPGRPWFCLDNPRQRTGGEMQEPSTAMGTLQHAYIVRNRQIQTCCLCATSSTRAHSWTAGS